MSWIVKFSSKNDQVERKKCDTVNVVITLSSKRMSTLLLSVQRRAIFVQLIKHDNNERERKREAAAGWLISQTRRSM